MLDALRNTCSSGLDKLHADLCADSGLVSLLREEARADVEQAAAVVAERVINKFNAVPSATEVANVVYTEAALEKAQRMQQQLTYKAPLKFGVGCDVLFHSATDSSDFLYLQGDVERG